MEEVLKDKRFAHIAKDPKFRRIPKSERKVKIDDRFRSMFKDKKFKVKCTIDKRGRPVNQTSNENLRKYYELSSSENSDEEEEDSDSTAKSESSTAQKKSESQKISKNQSKDSKNDHKVLQRKKVTKLVNKKVNIQENDIKSVSTLKNSDSESDSAVDSAADEPEDLNENEELPLILTKNRKTKINPDIQLKLRDSTIDYARGEGVLLSDDSSSDEESSEQDDEDDAEIEHDWGELDKEAETTDETTCRLAACNMDWDRIRAVDLLVLFHSFLPPGGMISSVKIYPSDFGLQRMKEEEAKGPIELVEAEEKRKDVDTDDENEEGSRYHMEKMRQYQLNRLKYYYAVIECDSPETANKIYTECDGIEYESTSTKLDLRFIPDDMEFDHEPREVCSKLPEPTKYQPRQFTTTALQQVKVELTWDETNPERQEMTQKINSGKLDEIDENDMRAYLASGTSDDESESDAEGKQDDSDNSEAEEISKKNPIDKYKCLLKSIEDKEEAKRSKEVELEFTWGLGAKEKTEKMVQERLSKSEVLTPFEEYLEKRKAKKKAKKEERRAKRETAENSDSNGGDDGDSVPSDVDMNDPYFAQEINERRKRNKIEKSRVGPSGSSDPDRREEDARKRAELELLLLDKDDDAGKQHFDMKKVEEEASLSKSKKKRLKKKRGNGDESNQPEDDFQVDVADPRFAALYSSHHYNIDPADPHYRKTKGTEALINEKLKRRADPNIKEEIPLKHPKTNGKMSADLAALVKSVKRNTKNISKPIK